MRSFFSFSSAAELAAYSVLDELSLDGAVAPGAGVLPAGGVGIFDETPARYEPRPIT